MRVDEMEAGRELDVLVAETLGWKLRGPYKMGSYKVLGCKIERKPEMRWIRPENLALGCDEYGIHYHETGWFGVGSPLLHFSTDIAAILPVAEQVVGTGHIKIKLMPPDEWNELYLAQVALWLGYIDPVRTAAEAATGGQAIALALARAVVKAKETTP